MMKTITLIARILLGIILLIFGLNGFYTFIPVPEFHPFMEIMVSSGFIYVEKTMEVVGGILLLSNRYVLLALLILGPILVNIMLYHALIDPRNGFMGILLLLLYGILILKYWRHFNVFFTAKVD